MQFIIICVILICCGIAYFLGARLTKKKIDKQIQQHNYKEQKKYRQQLQQEKDKLQKECIKIQNKTSQLQENFLQHKNNLDCELAHYLVELQQKKTDYEDNLSQAKNAYLQTIEKEYSIAENKYDIQMARLEQEKQIVWAKIEDLKNKLAAGVQAQLREKEKQDNLNFYKLKITENELQEIAILEGIKGQLKHPVILSKLIWTNYFQKQTTELCNRVIGNTAPACGIYKITNLKTQQCYIGQSVDIAARFKQHIKCGLGIDAPATNKFYKAMQEAGVWNFTFEILEKCSRSELNDKEKFWINMFQTDIFGYNATRGGS